MLPAVQYRKNSRCDWWAYRSIYYTACTETLRAFQRSYFPKDICLNLNSAWGYLCFKTRSWLKKKCLVCPQIDEVGRVIFEERRREREISLVLITGVETLSVINMHKYNKWEKMFLSPRYSFTFGLVWGGVFSFCCFLFFFSFSLWEVYSFESPSPSSYFS